MKKVLIVETNVMHYQGTKEPTGLWLGEAAEFVAEMEKNGIEVDYVSPRGGFVPLDPRSMKYVDEEILRIYENPDFIERGLTHTLKPKEVNPAEYIAIYYTGGHGVMWDFPDNQELQEIAYHIYHHQGFISSVCHGVAGLLNIKNDSGEYLIKGKTMTGFTLSEEVLAGKKRIVPFYNEEEAKKRGANFKKKRFYSENAIRDGRLITGQNPFSTRAVAKLLVAAIKNK